MISQSSSRTFFVTGLPRSRTAWFANLFTWGDSICYHDELHADPTIYRLVHILQQVPDICGARRGHSCASNLLAWRELSEVFPHAKWVVIERPFDDVLSACSAILPSARRDALLSMYYQLVGIIKELDPMVVQWDGITRTQCYQIAHYLGVDIGPLDRVDMLLDMNIQIHPPVLRERLRALNVSTIVDTEEAA